MCTGPSLCWRAQGKLKLLQKCCNYETQQTKLHGELHVCLWVRWVWESQQGAEDSEWTPGFDISPPHTLSGAEP